MSVVCSSSVSNAQECRYIDNPKTGEKSERWLEVNGEMFFWAPEEMGRKYLDLELENRFLQKENERLSKSLSVSDSIVEKQSDQLRLMEVRDATQKDTISLLSKAAVPIAPVVPKWYERDAVKIFATAVVTAAAFGYWSWTDRTRHAQPGEVD